MKLTHESNWKTKVRGPPDTGKASACLNFAWSDPGGKVQ